MLRLPGMPELWPWAGGLLSVAGSNASKPSSEASLSRAEPLAKMVRYAHTGALFQRNFSTWSVLHSLMFSPACPRKFECLSLFFCFAVRLTWRDCPAFENILVLILRPCRPSSCSRDSVHRRTCPQSSCSARWTGSTAWRGSAS